MLLLSACGGGTAARLSDLVISDGSLDQLFQSSQLDYTAEVNFLTTSVAVTATATEANAGISINRSIQSDTAMEC